MRMGQGHGEDSDGGVVDANDHTSLLVFQV